MFWIRSGLQGMSISDWLTSAPAAVAEDGAALEDVRQAMLDVLGETGAKRWAGLSVRLRVAMTAQALWELRPALMTATSQLHGELEGGKRLARITVLFEGLLPVASAGRKRKSAASALGRR